jgi:hypothetical protein
MRKRGRRAKRSRSPASRPRFGLRAILLAVTAAGLSYYALPRSLEPPVVQETYPGRCVRGMVHLPCGAYSRLEMAHLSHFFRPRGAPLSNVSTYFRRCDPRQLSHPVSFPARAPALQGDRAVGSV